MVYACIYMYHAKWKEVSIADALLFCHPVNFNQNKFLNWRRNLMKKLYTIMAVILAARVHSERMRWKSCTTKDLLSEVKARGTLVISTDPAYPPQSELKANPARTPGTKCTSDQKTLGELEGFDIDTAAAIAKGLGVERAGSRLTGRSSPPEIGQAAGISASVR